MNSGRIGDFIYQATSTGYLMRDIDIDRWYPFTKQEFEKLREFYADMKDSTDKMMRDIEGLEMVNSEYLVSDNLSVLKARGEFNRTWIIFLGRKQFLIPFDGWTKFYNEVYLINHR